jgi:hypothetical protein
MNQDGTCSILRSMKPAWRCRAGARERLHHSHLEQFVLSHCIPAHQGQTGGLGLWDLDPTTSSAPIPGRTSQGDRRRFRRGQFPSNSPIPDGVRARIVLLVGKCSPGRAQVGAAFGCLAALVTGHSTHGAEGVWPSTATTAAAAPTSPTCWLPSIRHPARGMSQERFEWLAKGGGADFKTAGSRATARRSRQVWELRASGDQIRLQQFEDMGNYLCSTRHGRAMAELVPPGLRDSQFRGVILSTVPAAPCNRRKSQDPSFPRKIAPARRPSAQRAQQRFGVHRIEGIGDKHIPWVTITRLRHVIVVDDEVPEAHPPLQRTPWDVIFLAARRPTGCGGARLLAILRGNTIAGHHVRQVLRTDEEDVVQTVASDSMRCYGSRLSGMDEAHGPLPRRRPPRPGASCGPRPGYHGELTYFGRKRLHNLKYYSRVEQRANPSTRPGQWYDPGLWTSFPALAPE